jgi:hypothetical protein
MAWNDVGVNVDEVGDDLYGLSPDQFVEARNARAKALVASGDREMAAAVRRLPKPAHSAWLANVLIRTHPREIDELLDLGRELREAQAGGAGGEMRRLSTRRHELVQVLVVIASDAARTAGHKFGTQLQTELEETLDAAVADPSAATELRSGQLAGPLRHVGFGEGGTLTPGSRVRSQGPKAKQEASGPRGPRGGPRQAVADPQAGVAANRALSKAQVALESSRKAAESARVRHDVASARRRDAAKALREAERELVRSSMDLQAADKLRKRDEQNLKQAEREYGGRQAKASKS